MKRAVHISQDMLRKDCNQLWIWIQVSRKTRMQSSSYPSGFDRKIHKPDQESPWILGMFKILCQLLRK